TPPMGDLGIRSSSVRHNRFFFTYNSFTQPTTLYLAEEDGSVREVRSLPDQFSAEGLEVEQHQATSEDGTQVPYFVVRQRIAPLDGSNPTLLTGYGGFQISSTPSYLGAFGKGWVEGGGVYVLANIRGGGEFGPSWWKAALKEDRQRAYDDFIAVAEDLISRGITSPEHLGIMGGSNGGLLVGAALTQRPDLYGAVVAQVPLLDMKRYHKLLAGASWMAEYGDPDDPAEWAFISRYSPYQNLREDVEYPRPFIFTTTRDDRVHPGHARKMAALMESYGHDVLYFENVEGGHGAGVTPEQQAESMALTLAYLHKQLAEGEAPVGG
ncbi:MAG: prolyl oligopeptidase family serine peptidase, partial [Longimicrobiales bacterium]